MTWRCNFNDCCSMRRGGLLPSVMGPTCLLCALFRLASLLSPLNKSFLHRKLKPTKLLLTQLSFWPWISLLFSPSVKFFPHYLYPSSGLQTLYSTHRLKYSAGHGSFPIAFPMLETMVTGVLSSSRLRVIPRDHLRHPQSPLKIYALLSSFSLFSSFFSLLTFSLLLN